MNKISHLERPRWFRNYLLALLGLSLSVSSGWASGWSDWFRTTEQPGIEYRLRKGGDVYDSNKTEWEVEVRNTYLEKVRFSCILTTNWDWPETGWGLMNLRPGEKYGPWSDFIPKYIGALHITLRIREFEELD